MDAGGPKHAAAAAASVSAAASAPLSARQAVFPSMPAPMSQSSANTYGGIPGFEGILPEYIAVNEAPPPLPSPALATLAPPGQAEQQPRFAGGARPPASAGHPHRSSWYAGGPAGSNTTSSGSSPRKGVARMSERSTSSSSSSTSSYRVLSRLRGTVTAAAQQLTAGALGGRLPAPKKAPALDPLSPRSSHITEDGGSKDGGSKDMRFSGSFASMSSVGSGDAVSTNPSTTSRRKRTGRSFQSSGDGDDDVASAGGQVQFSPVPTSASNAASRRRLPSSISTSSAALDAYVDPNPTDPGYKVVFVHAASIYSSYVRTRHKNLRCFPFCGPSHNTHSFCGSAILLAVFQFPRGPDAPKPEPMVSSEYAVVGMMRSSTSPLPSHSVLMDELERVSKIHKKITTAPASKEIEAFDECLLDLAEPAGSHGEAEMFVIQPHRKWRYEYPLNRHSSEEHVYTVFLIRRDPQAFRILMVTDSPAFRIKSAWKNNTTTVHRPKIDLPPFTPSTIYNELVAMAATTATVKPASLMDASSQQLQQQHPPLQPFQQQQQQPPPGGYSYLAPTQSSSSLFSPTSIASQASTTSSGSGGGYSRFMGRYESGGWGANVSQMRPYPGFDISAGSGGGQSWGYSYGYAGGAAPYPRLSDLAPPANQGRSYFSSMGSIFPSMQAYRTQSGSSVPGLSSGTSTATSTGTASSFGLPPPSMTYQPITSPLNVAPRGLPPVTAPGQQQSQQHQQQQFMQQQQQYLQQQQQQQPWPPQPPPPPPHHPSRP